MLIKNMEIFVIYIYILYIYISELPRDGGRGSKVEVGHLEQHAHPGGQMYDLSTDKVERES